MIPRAVRVGLARLLANPHVAALAVLAVALAMRHVPIPRDLGLLAREIPIPRDMGLY